MCDWQMTIQVCVTVMCPYVFCQVSRADSGWWMRGFDQVTVDEIAAAADVGRMTVFNHFPRKEDMFFDRDEEGREILREALRECNPGVAPIETLRLLARRLATEQSPFVRFTVESQGFIETIEGSETLKARATAIRDELAQVVGVALGKSVGRKPTDPDAHLAAGLLLATWTVALIQAHRTEPDHFDQASSRSDTRPSGPLKNIHRSFGVIQRVDREISNELCAKYGGGYTAEVDPPVCQRLGHLRDGPQLVQTHYTDRVKVRCDAESRLCRGTDLPFSLQRCDKHDALIRCFRRASRDDELQVHCSIA